MEKPLLLCGLLFGLDIFEECSGFPVDLHSTGLRNAELWTSAAPLLAVAVLLCFVVLLAGCLCCRQTKGFQEFTDSTSSHSLSGTGGYVNNAASTTEFTIFPPLSASTQQQRLSVVGQTPGDRSSVVRFEPLPDLKPPQPVSRRPAAFNNVVSHGLSAQDWFEDPHANFPRQQLKYLRELGRGWFGKAVEGEAQGILPGEKTSKVVVKILHEDATATDHMYFLHEVKPYRDLKHPNVLRLLGRCLETDPFLVLLEACPSGDLKSFLSQNISTAEALSQQGVTLLMGCNIASGLEHMHQNGFVHTDLAARNCLVTSDLTVKIGDYGTNIENFKDDYYCAGEVALPIRWCAPETLFCTETTIETKEVTPGANVWNLGVVLWEICEFGKLPYSELTDDEVIVKVLGEGNHRLGLPSRSCLHRHNLYHLMRLCWSTASQRPALPQVLAMLNHLYTNREYANQDGDDVYNLKADEDFERRWEMFKPNTIPKTDNHLVNSTSAVVQSPTKETANAIPPIHVVDINKEDQFEEEPKKLFILSQPSFDSMLMSPRDASMVVSDTNSVTPLTTSPQPSLTSSTGGEFFMPTLQHRHKSPSLQNLRGSLDDLCECTSEPSDTAGALEPQQSKTSDSAVAEEQASKQETSTLSITLPEESIGTFISEPEFDSWLQGVETTDEEDAKFVRKISEAIRDLDNALALEKTSSSSSSSETSSHHQSPAKDVTPITSDQNVVLDFRLGPSGSSIFSPREVMFQPDSLQDDSLLERSLPRESNRTTDSGTDTEDEMWRRRIECGEFSAKVKEKSKSVADLMVLTHIECSDGSDSDPPSPLWGGERNLNSREPFSVWRRSSSNTFGSEGNIHHAVLGEEFQHTLMKLHEARKDIRGNDAETPSSSHILSRLQEDLKDLGTVDVETPIILDTLFTSHEAQVDITSIDAETPLPTNTLLRLQEDLGNLTNVKVENPTVFAPSHVLSRLQEDKEDNGSVETETPEITSSAHTLSRLQEDHQDLRNVELKTSELPSPVHSLSGMSEGRKDLKNVTVEISEIPSSTHLLSRLQEDHKDLASVEEETTPQVNTLTRLQEPHPNIKDIDAAAPLPIHNSTSLQNSTPLHDQESGFLDIDASETPKPSPEDVCVPLRNDRLVSERLIGSELDKVSLDESKEVGLEHRSKVPEVEVVCNGVADEQSASDCVRSMEDFVESLPLHSNIPVDGVSQPGSSHFRGYEQKETSGPMPEGVEHKLVLPDADPASLHPDGSTTSESNNCSDISLFAPSDIFSELRESELLDSSEFVNIFSGSPLKDNLFSPLPEHTSTPQSENCDRSIETSKHVKRNLEFEEPVSEIFSDLDDIHTSLSSGKPSDSLYFDSSSGSTRAQNSSAFGTSSDSFDFIPNTESSYSCNINKEPFANLSASRAEVDTFSDVEKQPKPLSSTHDDTEASVILGPWEDYTLDYFKGLKTTSEDIPTRVFDTDETGSEPLVCDTSEILVNDSEEKSLLDNNSKFSQDMILNSEKETDISISPFLVSTVLQESSNDRGSSFDHDRLLTNSFLEREIGAENSCRELVPVDSSYTHSKISCENECHPEDAHRKTDKSPLNELSVLNSNLLEDKLKNISTDLFVPSLNFIAATPIPSGRNSPEILVENQLPSPKDSETSDVLNDYSETTPEFAAPSENSSGVSMEGLALCEASDKQLETSVTEDKLNISFSPAKDSSEAPQEACSSSNQIPCLDSTHELNSPKTPQNENIVDKLLSSLSELSLKSKPLVTVNEMGATAVKDVDSKPEEVLLHEDILSPTDDTTKDSTSDMVSESLSTVKSNQFECDTIQNSPDVVEGHLLSFLPEEETHEAISSSSVREENFCEVDTTSPVGLVLSSKVDQLPTPQKLTDFTVEPPVKSPSSNNSECSGKVDDFSPKINSENTDSARNHLQGELGKVEILLESSLSKDLKIRPDLFEVRQLDVLGKDSDIVCNVGNNSDENGTLANKISNNQKLTEELTHKISSSIEDKTSNQFDPSSLLRETTPLEPKTDVKETFTIDVSSTDMILKGVSDVDEKLPSVPTLLLSCHKTDEPNLPSKLTSEVDLPPLKQQQLVDENVCVTPEPEQFCVTEAMDVFVKNIPGKTDDAVEKWKQQNIEILAEDFFQSSLDGKQFRGTDIEDHDFSSRFQAEESETAVELDDDGEDFGLDVAKHSTPDDERSSDSGFRDKGSLSESCEDACDEKYNLEDIEAELEETFNKGGFNYVVKGMDGEDDDLDHHHAGTDTSEDFRQSETPDGELDSESSPLGMCGKISPASQVVSTFSSEQKKNQICPENCTEKTDSSFANDPKSHSINSFSVDNLNDLNCKSKYVLETSSPTFVKLKYCSAETPDLLDIETSDIPMPDLMVDQRRHEVSPPGDTTSELPESNFHVHSGFAEKKDLILDIGQTEFRAFSPEHNTDSFLNTSELSPIRHMGGWFLHPPQGAGSGNDGDLMDDVFMSPKSTSSTTSNSSKDDENGSNENQYHPFNLDEEFVAALRSELQEKLPCARQHSREDDPEDDGVIDAEDELSQEERRDITIHYAYPPPLSPILEERESVSSITDNFCPFVQATKDDSDSDSEPGSPVFVLDSADVSTGEVDAQRFEQEIREALENCSLSSAETDSGRQKTSVLLEDLEQSSTRGDVEHPSGTVTVVKDTFQQPDFEDDFLVVDTETNHATLLESPKPKSYLAFVNKRPPQVTGIAKGTDVLDEKLAVINSSDGSFFLHPNKNTNFSVESENDKVLSDDAFTPDSISPGHEQQISLLSSDTDNLSGNCVSSDEAASSRLELELQIPAAYNPYFASSLAAQYSSSQGPVYDAVEEISLGLPNNEAAEIISELETSGIFNSLGRESSPNTSSQEPSEGSSRTTTENDSEALSFEDNSDSLKSGGSSLSVQAEKKNLSLALPNLGQSVPEVNGSEDDNVPLSSVSIKLEESVEEVSSPSRLFNDTLDLYKKKKAAQRGEVLPNEEDRLLSDTLDLYKKKTGLQKMELSPTTEDKDWSVTSLEAALLSTKAPMPSPEEESWKQIPSMLAFSDLNEVISRCGNEEMFGGSSSPTYPPAENDDDLMSTSFSLKGDSDDLADCYTPDWESESEDTNDDDNNSSSSGEFIWKDGDREASLKAVDMSAPSSSMKPYEGLSEFAMEVIAEEEEEEDDEDDDGSTSSESGTEFVPSAWNSEATPNRSALRSPDKKVEQKKNVSFKKQKYHCVYEYPREVSDSESDGLDSPSRRRWELYQPDVDYASYSDWELMEGDVPETANQEADLETEAANLQGQSPQTLDFYKLSDVDYDFGSGVMPEDGEFYISSSARPFQFSAADGDMFGGNSSQFFPGQLYRAGNVEDCSADTTTTATTTTSSTLGVSTAPCEDEVEQDVDLPETPSPSPSPSPSSPLSPTAGLGELRHTRDRLKLDLPVLDTPLSGPGKRRAVEPVRGEASLLDSGEDTEDSGIESSNGTRPQVS